MHTAGKCVGCRECELSCPAGIPLTTLYALIREEVREMFGYEPGAGLEEHVHFHVVPRWHGDTNYMPVVSGTRVIPEALVETYRSLKPLFEEYGNREFKV